MKALEELGKGFIALANLIFVLIFFKEAVLKSDMSLFVIGVLFTIGIYYVGYKLIKKSEKG
ncbi:hypothetical protein RZR97_09575 [Hydrogenimonas thermophila]|uniref:hypothetical protein n=1 Tax=Hydrogenimonas thermophila TaxID=223786 RepID=UPI0029371B7B|nr:hypothetical protein [Hydrogenimonas thermophila]WOE69355.1 hypothetical protein RZR91_09600 [Hydrogenimonas thermophila]WOE71865.1 hypothetical protein RZR97_09575 [Hydrogenimonas thermophila]